ncbi:alpha-L-fucosidase [Flagellimonas taeanensis]|uniref:alpha-L-fucosidase n=1 Tax=Flagellimonas taeanensis TaxID=1005926 RepID=A0A1M6P9N5_9FLAO|nr:alpha-L-fucosidase [Allomuricauda taeanensis]SFB66451.1 alpha-L-fucosidase [Allomuricauda taeanensis]SHK04572.1 alpha-L-fucosidase [Allomuricauda taeanensis]
MKHLPLISILLLVLMSNGQTNAQTYQPSAENLENREWFQDAKFGMFIHWGIYSVLGVHEWVMETQSIDKKTYEKAASFFNPTEFNAEEWVLLAKATGMKYITVTTKHHDGFALFDSQLTDWDIMDRTVYQQDVIGALAKACKKHGIKLFFYYSQLDWHHNDYFPRGQTGKAAGRPDTGNWDSYIDFMNGQLTELLTNYGDVTGIWFDGWWDKKDADWQLRKTYDLIHKIQPQALIGGNHHQAPKEGEDFQMFEKDLPGENKGGFSAEAKIGQLPLETAETMAHRWGFSLQDKAYKSSKELIHYLVKAAGHNSNFLLNVGPMPNGKIQQEFIDTLNVVGQWTSKYGESIFGTRGGPIAPQSWGVSTQRDNTVFVHILDWRSDAFLIPELDKQIKHIREFETKMDLSFDVTKYGILVALPENWENRTDYILEIGIE